MAKAIDMTGGKPLKLMISFTVPMLLSNLFQQLYGMVDTAIVGRGIGVGALAAVGSTGTLVYLIIGFLGGMSYGFGVEFAQCFGAHDERALNRAFCSSVRVGGILAAIFTLLSLLLADPLLALINTPADILAQSRTYILVIFAFTPILVAYDVLGSFLRSVGDSKTPLYAMLVSTGTNLVLDILLVIVIPLGVFGAAIATGIAQVVAAIYCLAVIVKNGMLKIEKEDWLYDRTLDLKLFRLGLPLAFQSSVTALGEMALQRLVNDLGSLYTAAYSAAGRVIYFAEIPGSCLGVAMATYAGQNKGANRLDRIREGVNRTLPFSAGVNLVLGVIMVLLRRPLTSVFADASSLEAILPIVSEMMIVQGLMKWVLGPLFIYRNALQGLGDTTTPMISGFVELAMRILAAYLLVEALGFLGICIAGVAAWIGAAVLLMIVYYRTMNKLTAASCLP